MYKRIKLGIAIVKTGASFIMNVKSTLGVPFIVGFLMIIAIALYIVGFIYNFSTGTITANLYGIPEVTLSDMQKYYLWYWTFSFLWVFNLIAALSLFIIASSACIWYFS